MDVFFTIGIVYIYFRYYRQSKVPKKNVPLGTSTGIGSNVNETQHCPRHELETLDCVDTGTIIYLMLYAVFEFTKLPHIKKVT